MLVSHRHSFIYTKTVKTGGTSVESYLEPFCMPEGEWVLSHARAETVTEAGIIGHRGPPGKTASTSWWNHMPASQIRAQLGEAVWTRYFKFCVVRNPFEKALSMFYFSRFQREKIVRFEGLDKEAEQFENWVCQTGSLPIDRDKYLIDGVFCLDDVIRYEKLIFDLERICKRIGSTGPGGTLPTFKAGIRPKEATVEALYTDKAINAVKAAYEFELDYFGYKFPAAKADALGK